MPFLTAAHLNKTDSYASSQFAERIRLEVAGDVFVGSQLGFFGQYADNSRATTELTINF